MAAFTLDKRKMISAAQRLYVEHIGDNIAPDGSTVDFRERDALHYVTYDLQQLVTRRARRAPPQPQLAALKGGERRIAGRRPELADAVREWREDA